MWVGYNIQPTVWRVQWPADVVQGYRDGKLTNSDLEMAAVLLQYLVAERLRPMARCHTHIWSDNSPATSWSTKMADKATSPMAGQLLRALAMRQRTTRSALPTVAHYAGSLNLLADTSSRSFDKFHHGNARGTPSQLDTNFLTSFNSVFPLSDFPQMPFVAARHPDIRHEFSRDLHSSWDQVAHATVDGTARATHWRNWAAWCSRFNFNTFLVATP